VAYVLPEILVSRNSARRPGYGAAALNILRGASLAALCNVKYTSIQWHRERPVTANAWIVRGMSRAVLGLVACGACGNAFGQGVTPASVIHGGITTDDGAVYEGALRFGGDDEAAWGNYFNGVKNSNPWAVRVPPEQLRERVPVEFFGVPIARFDREIDLGRPFMARFGDIARIDAPGRSLRVTLKSGTVFELDRFSADDFADGVRVWDARRGVVDLDEWQVDSIEFLAAPQAVAAPELLHGTVRTPQGDFTGFVQWNRKQGVASDQLAIEPQEGRGVPFAAIRSIAHRSSDSALVSLRDGREIVLSRSPDVGDRSRGIYVDDARYGRVLISWDAFERIDFSAGGTAPAYDDFPPGLPLTGGVVMRSGRRLDGRLVYDLDESETTETLDAPWQGIDYTILFGLVASIELQALEDEGSLPHVRVTLHGGEELELERSGDLSDRNAGVLVFLDDRERPEYVPWSDVARLHFDGPPRP
jgi:hypothetical protein